jgi:two-component system, NtrC family, response regulator GlrR
VKPVIALGIAPFLRNVLRSGRTGPVGSATMERHMTRFQETAAQGDQSGYGGGRLARKPTLHWTDARGPHAREVSESLVIGGAPGVDLVIEDPAVSRLHAELELLDSGLWVHDLESRNGTFVQGVRVSRACIPDGAQLRVGATDLTVNYAPEATPVEIWPESHFGPMVGTSVPMRELFARLARVARSEATVLIQGETGTGKEVAARAIHEASPRAGEPFVIIDCGALPENLLEAELFGHSRGAFTGAVEARAGAVEAADGGTVFLDEIGEIPLNMQPKLLRVLESRTVRRVGETAHRPVNVRFLSATNRDLRTMVNTRAFREDLYFRLAVLPVTIPPLRERPSDILTLVKHFLPGDALSAVTPQMVRELMARPWLGNVRELRNFVERALALGAREALAMAGATAPPSASADMRLPPDLLALPYKEMRERVLLAAERDYIKGLLERHERNISAAAETAGLNRTYLYRLVAKHGL